MEGFTFDFQKMFLAGGLAMALILLFCPIRRDRVDVEYAFQALINVLLDIKCRRAIFDQFSHVWSRGVARWFRCSLSVADSFVRVEESTTSCRWSLAVSAVSGFVPV
jgi:hypothetical protein